MQVQETPAAQLQPAHKLHAQPQSRSPSSRCSQSRQHSRNHRQSRQHSLSQCLRSTRSLTPVPTTPLPSSCVPAGSFGAGPLSPPTSPSHLHVRLAANSVSSLGAGVHLWLHVGVTHQQPLAQVLLIQESTHCSHQNEGQPKGPQQPRQLQAAAAAKKSSQARTRHRRQSVSPDPFGTSTDERKQQEGPKNVPLLLPAPPPKKHIHQEVGV